MYCKAKLNLNTKQDWKKQYDPSEVHFEICGLNHTFPLGLPKILSSLKSLVSRQPSAVVIYCLIKPCILVVKKHLFIGRTRFYNSFPHKQIVEKSEDLIEKLLLHCILLAYLVTDSKNSKYQKKYFLNSMNNE